MRKFLGLGGAIVCLMTAFIAPSAHGQIYEPDRGPLQVGIGYQYQHYNVLGQTFHDNGYNADLSLHVFDWITGASLRVAVAAEGTMAFGFGGHTGGTPNLEAKSLFIGGGPHVSIESRSRIEPWLHVLPGWQHFRFTQTSTLGSNNAFGFMAGGGLDFKLNPRVYWRVQADYIGTRFQSAVQSNYSIGSGVVFYF
jgi:opacity protein-like surface antigen